MQALSPEMTEDGSSAVYGAIVDGATEFNHTLEIHGKEHFSAVTAITVYTAKVAHGEHEEELIVDIAFEYSVGGKLHQAGPYGSGAAAGVESSTFGLPGERCMRNTATKVHEWTSNANLTPA